MALGDWLDIELLDECPEQVELAQLNTSFAKNRVRHRYMKHGVWEEKCVGVAVAGEFHLRCGAKANNEALRGVCVKCVFVSVLYPVQGVL